MIDSNSFPEKFIVVCYVKSETMEALFKIASLGYSLDEYCRRMMIGPGVYSGLLLPYGKYLCPIVRDGRCSALRDADISLTRGRSEGIRIYEYDEFMEMFEENTDMVDENAPSVEDFFAEVMTDGVLDW